VKEGGNPLSAVEAIQVVQLDADAITCRIGAGHYVFEFPWDTVYPEVRGERSYKRRLRAAGRAVPAAGEPSIPKKKMPQN
jgi:hypothetical protein